MKKFWRSGMIDKKIVAEREQAEYINKLQRTILELRRKPPEPEPRYAIIHTSDNRSHKVRIADDYDEIRRGDETILDFYKPIDKESPTRASIREMYEWCLKHRKEYDGMDWEKILNEIHQSREFKEK